MGEDIKYISLAKMVAIIENNPNCLPADIPRRLLLGICYVVNGELKYRYCRLSEAKKAQQTVMGKYFHYKMMIRKLNISII